MPVFCTLLSSPILSHTHIGQLWWTRGHTGFLEVYWVVFHCANSCWTSSMYQAVDKALHVMLNKGDSLCSWKSMIYSWQPHFTLPLLLYHTYALIKAIHDLTLYWWYLILSLHQCVSSPPVKTYIQSPSSNSTCWSFLMLSPWPKAPSLC